MEKTQTCNRTIQPDKQSFHHNALEPLKFSDYNDNTDSTPYGSAPSSPGHEPPHCNSGRFFYSAPTSPMHHMLSSVSVTRLEDSGGSFEFELAGEPAPPESMSSADELFLNGQIRPMKLSSHLQHSQDLPSLADIVENEGEISGDDEDRKVGRGRALQSRDRRRKARSMSPLRSNTAFQWLEEFKDGRESTEINEIKEKLEAEDKHKQRAEDGTETETETETPSSGASSRSSSAGRSSKRWVFLKELLHRSKSEGRNSTNSTNSTNSNRNHKFWSTLPFTSSSGSKEKKPSDSATATVAGADETGTAVPMAVAEGGGVKTTAKKAVNGVGINRLRRSGRSASAHEVHYTRNRAQAEEMRKKTYLPYRQGLLGCLGFSTKSYGAMSGFARALNPVSSR